MPMYAAASGFDLFSPPEKALQENPNRTDSDHAPRDEGRAAKDHGYIH